MDFVLMIVVARAAASAGLAKIYVGMKIQGRRNEVVGKLLPQRPVHQDAKIGPRPPAKP
jgi:hypothetical protein